MTEEQTTTDADEKPASDLNDPRFEVKWRKKNDAPRPAHTDESENVASSGQPDSADVARLQAELDKERERVKDLQDRWQRASADLVNLRRRTESERGELEQFASMRLVQELLPVLDNFERAIATIPHNLGMLTWIQGIMLIQRHLEALLEQRGLTPIEAQGQPFSPHYHEAVSERESADASPGTVLQEYQKGYTMHGRVIRPTLVEIAKAPLTTEGGTASDTSLDAAATEPDDAETTAQKAVMENEGA